MMVSSDSIARRLEAEIAAALRSARVVAVVGARRVGKTSLVRHFRAIEISWVAYSKLLPQTNFVIMHCGYRGAISIIIAKAMGSKSISF